MTINAMRTTRVTSELWRSNFRKNDQEVFFKEMTLR